MKKSLIFVFLLVAAGASFTRAQNPTHTLIITRNTSTDTLLQPLLGVISGPLPGNGSPAPDLTPQFQDIGVTSIRNNAYWDDRLDIESIFSCPDTSTYPSWDCDPDNDAYYHWGPSDTLFQSFIDGGFEPFFRLGGEAHCSVREHDFHGPQNEIQEDHWITAALKIARRYTHWRGNKSPIRYLNIFTEWPNKEFWDRSDPEFIHFWAKAFKAVKSAFPGYKVGGPGFLAPTMNVIKGETTHNPAIAFLTELYNQQLRPDWIGWHLWQNNPERYYQAGRQFRDLLNGVGDFASVPWAGTDFFKGVELICDAYGVNPYEENSAGGLVELPRTKLNELMNKKEGAAMFTGIWIALQQTDVVRAYYYHAGDALSDPSAGPNDQNMGWTGLFYGDPRGSYKPKALAFRLCSQMVKNYPKLLSSDFPSVGTDSLKLWVLAGKGKSGYGVLISNTEEQAQTYSLILEGVPVRPANFQVEVYQVDDTNDGRTPIRWTGGSFEIPAGTVQMLVLKRGTTGVREAAAERPVTPTLLTNYPNPFNGVTTIRFSISRRARVRLDIFNLTGQKITTLFDGVLPAGEKSVFWDGTNAKNAAVPSGTYLCKLEIDGRTQTLHKLVYLK
ncbi:MAG: T9SS type A sorting domain-containing protein [Calditrichaeota bacterium]|nr:T9SS type A sorting domain-containing protein [Calditrichota bacterium]